MTATPRAVVAALLLCAALVAPVGATTTTTTTTSASASQLYISGAGFGHGVGMSQYGAAGFALHGYTYEQILSHYYSATTLGKVNPMRTVTVLLHEGAATFSGASAIVGYPKKLLPNSSYRVIPHGSKLRIIRGAHIVGTFAQPVIVHDKGGLHGTGAPLTLLGQGAYDGVFIFRLDGTGGVMTVNSVPLDEYVRGVVTAEMPSNWPAQALEAQAVAARTYAITAGTVAADFDVYDDTRSQMYRGISSQTASGNAAVAATSGKVVEYDGQPVATYFFSSSGGYTESVQNVWYRIAPEPWLHGVPDPYDDSYDNPYYRWTNSYTLVSAEQKVRMLYRGALEGIKITQTGISPRVVHAVVVGTGGASTVTGTQLQQLFGTRSTYMSFTTLTAKGKRTKTVVKTTKSPATSTGATTTSTPVKTVPTTATTTTSTAPITTTTSRESGALTKPASNATKKVTIRLSVLGTVYPAKQGQTVTAQRRAGWGWRSVARARLTSKGSYVITVTTPGTYRVVYEGLDGPNINVP
jgi:stage II sporulation protein D